MTTEEIAQYLRISVRTVIRMRQQREGPPWSRVGRQVRYLRNEVDEYLRRQQVWPPRSAKPDRST
ncbi:helix-turn-helix domain-containing protein [Aquisalimonas asiatica]|uniref:helix-turn-helix domain-containing protein n=1 Tax=Aquisalimonas asiatica TaxID=406100 RepID=UPI002481FBF1|nr:helix-turn-helix domain-containing protein [Aquisalimonas asiatica]